jgi:hypothetical protein
MPSKALEMGVCFHTDPVLGNMGGRGTHLSYGLRERGEVSFLSGELLLRNSTDMYNKALSIADPNGEPAGGSFSWTV